MVKLRAILNTFYSNEIVRVEDREIQILRRAMQRDEDFPNTAEDHAS